jgi:hypothetical protein
MLKRLPIINVYTFVVFLLAASIGLFYLFSQYSNTKLLQTYGLVPTQEGYTELYIEDHQKLPNFLGVGKEATASFTLRNNEYKLKNYKFIITKTLEKETDVIGSGSASLAHGQSKSFEFHFDVATTSARTRVEVAIPDLKQSVHFFVNTK